MASYRPPSIRRHIRERLPDMHAASDGARALDLVRRIVDTDRWNSFERFHQTTGTLCEAYEAAGARTEVIPVHTGGRLGSGRWVIHEAIDVHDATLDMIAPSQRRLADYHDCPWHVAQCGAATPAEGLRGELVVLDDPEQLAQLRPGALRGRFLLTSLPLRRWLKPIADAGARVAISDAAVRNLPDAVAWTKLGWGGVPIAEGPTRLVGFALSANQGRELRRVHEAHGPVMLHAKADLRRYVGSHDVVSGLVMGQDDPQEEVWALAHSGEPGAIDNASGVATCVEIARVLESLIARGALRRPRRTIRLLNAYECYGFFAYLEQRRALQPPLAGVNLDGVGARPEVCDGGVRWHATVPGSASFVDRVGEAFLRGALRIDDAYRYTSERFVSTDDTLIGDPRYGFPCPWLTTQRRGGWKFDAYHSSADTPDLLSERGLKFCAAAMAGYLHYLADAGTEELLELAEAETRHFTSRLAQASQAEAHYVRQQHEASLQRLERWMWSGDRAAVLEQLTAHRRQLDEQMPTPTPTPPSQSSRRHGGRQVPRRKVLLTPTLENTPAPLAARIRSSRLHPWALFWADGRRNLREIAALLSVEHSQPVTLAQVGTFFEAHAELGYVDLIEPREMVSKAQLVRDLRALGLARGMDVMVHSSLSRIGHVAGGAEAVVEALLEVIGRRGTLMMPSFNHRRTTVFNPRTTPTTNGAIPDAMWRRPEAVRSNQPTHPVAAIGPRAERYCHDHARRGVWAADSPIGQLIEHGGYVLSLGVTHAATTAMHVAEIAVPCRCIDQFAVTDHVVGAEGSVREVSGVAYRDGPCPVSARELDKAMRRHRHQRAGTVGHAEATLVKAEHVYHTRIRQLRNVCPTCTVRPRIPGS